MPDNLDANDVAVTFGLEAVRDAFRQRRSTIPPSAPFDDAYMGDGEPEAPAQMAATQFVWRDEREIEPRRWLYGKHLLRKFLSVDVAAGGIGKSSVKVVEALAMTSGRSLLRKDVPEGPLRVWLYNLEDPFEETERRLHAALNHYGFPSVVTARHDTAGVDGRGHLFRPRGERTGRLHQNFAAGRRDGNAQSAFTVVNPDQPVRADFNLSAKHVADRSGGNFEAGNSRKDIRHLRDKARPCFSGNGRHLLEGGDGIGCGHHAASALDGAAAACSAASTTARSLLIEARLAPTGFGFRSLCFQRLKVVG